MTITDPQAELRGRVLKVFRVSDEYMPTDLEVDGIVDLIREVQCEVLEKVIKMQKHLFNNPETLVIGIAASDVMGLIESVRGRE